MDILILIFLVAITAILAFIVIKSQMSQPGKDKLEAVLNQKFLDFSDNIRSVMEKTREQVESSKDVLSKNSIDTLVHINNMQETVGNLVKQQEKAQELGQSLEYLLQTPKLRGNYGETVLEEMLDRVLPKGIWERQYSIDGNEKVDAVVKYKDVVVPIDSKFPRDDYQKYLSAKNEQEKKAHWVNYEKALKVQINSIKDKYIKPEKGTTEFALLFIPSEAIYYETIAEKNYVGDPCKIYEYSAEKKVIPVSPNTFYAFLQVVLLGVRNIEIVRDARKLQEGLSRVEKDFEQFFGKYEIIGKNLEKASEAYRTGEGHIQRFKRNLDASINKLDDKFVTEEKEKIFIKKNES